MLFSHLLIHIIKGKRKDGEKVEGPESWPIVYERGDASVRGYLFSAKNVSHNAMVVSISFILLVLVFFLPDDGVFVH